MRIYYKTSLFLYEVVDSGPTPLIVFWRATVFTFGRGANFRTLKRILREFSETGVLIEPKSKRVSREKRQVPASDSRGLGFNWVEISRGEKRGGYLQPEERMGLWQLQAYETLDSRLGYSEFLRAASDYGKTKRALQRVGRAVKSFWKWLAS